MAVVNPCKTSGVRNAAAQTGATAESEEKRKTHLYKDSASAVGNKFQPLVLETFGHWGPALKLLVSRLAKKHADGFADTTQQLDWSAKKFTSYATQVLSMTLMYGTARGLLKIARLIRDQSLDFDSTLLDPSAALSLGSHFVPQPPSVPLPSRRQQGWHYSRPRSRSYCVNVGLGLLGLGDAFLAPPDPLRSVARPLPAGSVTAPGTSSLRAGLGSGNMASAN